MRDIDAIIARLRVKHLDISAEQLTVVHHGADDNGVWFFRHPATAVEVQLESSTGTFPFVFESSGTSSQLTARTIEQAVTFVVTALGGARPAA